MIKSPPDDPPLESEDEEVKQISTVLPPRPFSEIIDFLAQQQRFNCNRASFECEPIGAIQPEDIQRSLSLPYEIELTERDGKVVVTTGTATTTSNDNHGSLERSRSSRLWFHTHRKHHDKISITIPSFADIFTLGHRSENTLLSLGHEGGLATFRRPTLSGHDQNTDPSHVMYLWGEANKIDLLGFGRNQEKISFPECSRFEQLEITARFVAETQMITQSASWDDATGIRAIMEFINLRHLGQQFETADTKQLLRKLL